MDKGHKCCEQRKSISPCITFLASRKESSITCAWGGSSHKLRLSLTHPIFFNIKILSYGLNVPDKTSDKAMEGKEILMFRQGSYTCHQAMKQENSAVPRSVLQSGILTDWDFSTPIHVTTFQDVFISLVLKCTTLTEGNSNIDLPKPTTGDNAPAWEKKPCRWKLHCYCQEAL